MKKILLFLLICGSVFAQNHGKIAAKIESIQKENQKFKVFSILSRQTHPVNLEYLKSVDNATIATLDLEQINTIVAEKNEYLEIDFPYSGKMISVLLYKVDIQAEGFQLDTDKQKNVPVAKGVHYRGIIKGDGNSIASFNFFRNQMNAVVSGRPYSNLTIGKLEIQGNVKDYIIYSDNGLKEKNTFSCATPDVLPKEIIPGISAGRSENLTQHCVTIYFEMEYSLYTANGSDVAQSNIWMNSVFNNIQTLYNNDDISVAIKSIFVWTTQDPYEGTSSYEYLEQFHEHTPVFNGDLGQLVGIDQGLGGVAVGLRGLCTDNNYSYSDVYFQYNTVPVFSWTVQVITHELGHLMGSPHTHGCYWNGNNTAIDGCGPTANINYSEGNCDIGPIPTEEEQGTIMSYCHLLSTGISLANGFGPQPSARIIQRVNAAQCLSSDCINTCISMISNISINQITQNSAVISWNDTDVSSAVEVAAVAYPYDVSSANWTIANSNPFTLTGLAPNTYYQFFIRKSCGSSLKSFPRESFFATSDDFCAGRPFTDTGGANDTYDDGENWIRTVAPINPNDKIKVTFTYYDIEEGYDFLDIINGADTSGELLDELSGTGSAGPFTATNATGALTFWFYSDQYTTGNGWEGNFSCENLGIGGNDFIDFSYFPNPVKNNISVKSKNEISNISIYSIDGKLLYQNAEKLFDTTIDLSGYATGTYVFRLQFENKNATFKVIKQ